VCVGYSQILTSFSYFSICIGEQDIVFVIPNAVFTVYFGLVGKQLK